jgi:hypothetical protein
MNDNMTDEKYKARCKMWADKLMVEVSAGRVDSNWDEEFICSVRDQIKAGRVLSRKQHDKLEELFVKY